jgi:hypothetical protein
MEGPGFEVIEYVPGTGKESVIASFETADKPVDAAWNASGNVLFLRGTLDAKVVFP